jgi:putative transposase
MLKPLTELTLTERWSEVKPTDEESLWGDLRPEALHVVKELLEGTMRIEQTDYIERERYERGGGRGYRNGFYERDLQTEMGVLRRLRVPRTRDGKFQTKAFARYQRRQAAVNAAVREMFLRGVSTRKVGEVMKPLLGFEVSAATVSEIAKSLDAEVRKYHRRPLTDDYEYLILDGIWLKVRGAAKAQKKVILCAYGITKAGKREMVDFLLARSESEAAWEGFLNELYERGLEGKTLRLVTTDGAPGCERAVEMVYPRAGRQRCWAHKLRNVAGKVRRKNEAECVGEAKRIYQAETKSEAVERYWEWASRWREEEPKAVRCLEKDLDPLLAFLKRPKEHWKKIRTTNAIERAFREVRRRTRPMSCFQNDESVERVIYGVLNHLNQHWKKNPLKKFTQNS